MVSSLELRTENQELRNTRTKEQGNKRAREQENKRTREQENKRIREQTTDTNSRSVVQKRGGVEGPPSTKIPSSVCYD
jgi:hypothetical protein